MDSLCLTLGEARRFKLTRDYLLPSLSLLFGWIMKIDFLSLWEIFPLYYGKQYFLTRSFSLLQLEKFPLPVVTTSLGKSRQHAWSFIKLFPRSQNRQTFPQGFFTNSVKCSPLVRGPTKGLGAADKGMMVREMLESVSRHFHGGQNCL